MRAGGCASLWTRRTSEYILSIQVCRIILQYEECRDCGRRVQMRAWGAEIGWKEGRARLPWRSRLAGPGSENAGERVAWGSMLGYQTRSLACGRGMLCCLGVGGTDEWGPGLETSRRVLTVCVAVSVAVSLRHDPRVTRKKDEEKQERERKKMEKEEVGRLDALVRSVDPFAMHDHQPWKRGGGARHVVTRHDVQDRAAATGWAMEDE
jgi:hypothetical protein